LAYWREQNERLQEKRQLQTRMVFLQREFAWSRVLNLEAVVNNLTQELDQADADLFKAEEETQRYARTVVEGEENLKMLRSEWLEIIERRIESERALGVNEYSINTVKERILELQRMLDNNSEQRRHFDEAATQLKEHLNKGPTKLDDYFNLFQEVERTQEETYESWKNELIKLRRESENRINTLSQQLGDVESAVNESLEQSEGIRAKIDAATDQYVDARIQLALLKDQRGRLKRHIDELKAEIDRSNQERRDAETEAQIRGPRVETGRTGDEIIGEIKKTSGILQGLAIVPEDAGEMYESYSRTYKELQQKIEKVREDRRQVMEEIETRTKKWGEVIHNLLDEVNARYQSLLSHLQARGEVRIINPTDIEEAGLEIFVSFKGGQLSKLDPYTHSGGERSTSVMAFLLALQQNVLSPFRAVDEFDLHMDPKNKEVVSEFIVSTMEGTKDQYMAITPSQVTFHGKDVHIIMIHKTENTSTVRMVEN